MGIWKTQMPMCSINVTLLKSMYFVQSPVKSLRSILLWWRNRYCHDTAGHVAIVSQLQNTPTFIFQQGGSPAHFHCEVCQCLNTVLPERWTGRASGNNQPLMLWPPRSPDITPFDFFLPLGDMSKTGYSPHHCHVNSPT
jgi:hypothetical protein